ncbi:uncharacterized protein LOC113272733 [Papaver somniferum]|uniref:uncharacterized protein LOC113272733 n=1 Tax=Papaver somniferum TaxID=3469 RepID=UPI000E6F7732|nr:uncharacterized protein LOC113272733 [Papaver somniferum]
MEGSSNSNFFHSNIKIRKTTNAICELEEENGNLVSDQARISDMLVNFFEQRFKSQDVVVNDSILDVIPKIIIESDQFMLEVIPEAEEIKAAVFGMDGDSEPGPDSFSGMFYKFFSSMVFPRIGQWLEVLLSSAKISVMVNGGLNSFFSMQRGLKQRDLLSPILFVLMEEVLSKNLTRLVETNKIQPMVTRNGIAPTHFLFADDIFLFSNGSKKSILNLLQLLDDYQLCSGQSINKVKSKCFIDGCSNVRKAQIANILQMELTSFPDKYLGVIIHPGRVKTATLWPMVEKMQEYLAVWKGMILTKHVLSSIPIYNMDEDWGLEDFSDINKALLMKMMWRLISSKEDWSLFFAAKFKDKNGKWTEKWKLSSVWPGLKWAWKSLKCDARWLIGNGEYTSVWFDLWNGEFPIIDRTGFTEYVKSNL